MKEDNTNILLKIKEEELEDKEEMTIQKEEEEEEVEEDKEDLKDKHQNNKLQFNKLLNNNNKLEHVLCELLFNSTYFLFFEIFLHI